MENEARVILRFASLQYFENLPTEATSFAYCPSPNDLTISSARHNKNGRVAVSHSLNGLLATLVEPATSDSSHGVIASHTLAFLRELEICFAALSANFPLGRCAEIDLPHAGERLIREGSSSHQQACPQQ